MTATLDEWRLWNGARSSAAVRDGMRRPLSPRAAEVAAYGDPTSVGGDVTATVNVANYAVAAAVLAVYRLSRLDGVYTLYSDVGTAVFRGGAGAARDDSEGRWVVKPCVAGRGRGY